MIFKFGSNKIFNDSNKIYLIVNYLKEIYLYKNLK